MLHILELSKSGYYDYKNRKPSKQKIKKDYLTKEIKQIHKESKEIYGAPKIRALLLKKGHSVSIKQVSNIMKENNIKACYIKPYTATTRDSNFSTKLKNVLDRKFNPANPNEVWCSDITYIWTQEDGFVYLTSVMDLYSRKIIAYRLSKTMEVEEVIKCIEQAKTNRKGVEAKIIHSDRGSQYTSKKYDEVTQNMNKSYSDKGVPYDNACIESFHALIKREWLERYKIIDYYDAYRLVFEYIEGFYNTIRIHSYCGYVSPNQFEANTTN